MLTYNTLNNVCIWTIYIGAKESCSGEDVWIFKRWRQSCCSKSFILYSETKAEAWSATVSIPRCGILLFKELSFCRVEKCRFFDSKMRPLLLIYENEDSSLRLSQTDPSPFSEIKLIFKCGDGQWIAYMLCWYS